MQFKSKVMFPTDFNLMTSKIILFKQNHVNLFYYLDGNFNHFGFKSRIFDRAKRYQVIERAEVQLYYIVNVFETKELRTTIV